MLATFFIVLLLVSNGAVYGMDNQNQHVELSQISPTTPPMQTAENAPQPASNKMCSGNTKYIVLCLSTTTACALLVTGLYAANIPQRCLASNEPYLNEFEPFNIEGYSFDVETRNCGQCVYSSSICINPTPGIKDSNQLIQYVNASMQPICGNGAQYHIRPNLVLKSGSPTEGSQNFNDAMKMVSTNCKSSGKQGNKGKARFSKPQAFKKN